MKRFVALVVGVLAIVSIHTSFAQGTVVFNNNANTLITNCQARTPQPARTIKLGLYFTPDLSAVSNTTALASMLLVRITTNAPTAGAFIGGTVTLPGVTIGASVVLQCKAWPTNYTSFEQARDAGADIAESLPWVQHTGGSVFPPSMIARWGFRPFLYPQCEIPRVPLFVERDGAKVRVCWPVGVPPAVQMNDGLSTNWQTLTSGTFVDDHWEFDAIPGGGANLFRLAE